MLRAYAICVYIFLYMPITLIVFFSFNAGKYAMSWEGFSVFWYGKAFSNPLIMGALRTSVIIALSTAILSAIIGTLTALGLERTKGWLRITFDALIYIAIMVPGIVIGISTLIAFVSFFDLVNPSLAGLGIKLQMGTWAVIAAHVLFNIAVVALLVRARLQGMDRSLVDASEDLYATPMGTFRQVVLPLLAPSILAGFRISASIALLLVVSAEMIGAEKGIGAFVLQAGNLMQTDQLLAGVVVLSLIGLAVARAIGARETRLVDWR